MAFGVTSTDNVHRWMIEEFLFCLLLLLCSIDVYYLMQNEDFLFGRTIMGMIGKAS